MPEQIFAKFKHVNGKTETETLEEHTRALIKNLEILKKHYSTEIEKPGKLRIWRLLELACLYHDLGKVSDHFQNKIRKKAGLKPLNSQISSPEEIPHNYLSPSFLLFIKDLDEDTELLPLFYAISYHHDREIKFNKKYLSEIINKDLKTKIGYLDWLKEYSLELNENLWDGYFDLLDESNRNIPQYERIKHTKGYILLKGLLHRLDHSASAHLPVEEKRYKNVSAKLVSYLEKKSSERNMVFTGLKPFQQEAGKYRDKSVLLIASTGMGKTEFALNWAGDDKVFYTLPLRVSVNAMYERIVDIFCEKKNNENKCIDSDLRIGLLHGDSLLYGLEDLDSEIEKEFSEELLSMEEHISRVKVSRQLAMPVTITTADQLFTSVFKWKGYEKIYATLMYSKVILDEPQSYSPEILAMIIKSLQIISDYGGRFCFMSATIHPIVKKYLTEKHCVFLTPDDAINKERKHKIKLVDDSIENLSELIESNFNEGKKILVIANTVKKAQEIYKNLEYIGNVKLLHSCFIQRDRRIKEAEIISDYQSPEPVIWVSTQIIEASLDIDYDILFTELATFDALIQRMGRIYRKVGMERIVDKDSPPNIFIASEAPSGKKYIYDTDITDYTKEVLQEYDGQILTEKIKQDLMDRIFNSERAGKFNSKIRKYFNLLDSGFEAANKHEAQMLFRNITNITVIPMQVFQKNEEEIETALKGIKDKDKNETERLICIKKLNDFTLSIPYYKVEKKGKAPLKPRKDIFLLDVKYNDEMGLDLNTDKLSYEFI